MSKRRIFLVEAGKNGAGYTIGGKAVVIEADLNEETNRAEVISPREFANEWSSVKVPGMGGWKECEGPARVLENDEYEKLVEQLNNPPKPQ